MVPDPAQLPLLPVFESAPANFSGLNLLAVAAASTSIGSGAPLSGQAGAVAMTALLSPGPYNPVASLPLKVVKKVLDLESFEMSELREDILMDDTAPANNTPNTQVNSKTSGYHTRVWLKYYAQKAALFISRFPQKEYELWAYQSAILKATHNYEGSHWVTYDWQFHGNMLA